MAIEFYNVKKKKKVEYKRETTKGVQVRYAFRAQDDDGTNLTKFVSKADYDNVDAPVVA